MMEVDEAIEMSFVLALVYVSPMNATEGAASSDWAERLNGSIAKSIKAERLRQKISLQRLSDMCTHTGHEITKTTLLNIESGKKKSISIPELLVLSVVLGIPAAGLVFDRGDAPLVEYSPGSPEPLNRAATWFGGADFPTDSRYPRAQRGTVRAKQFINLVRFANRVDEHLSLARELIQDATINFDGAPIEDAIQEVLSKYNDHIGQGLRPRDIDDSPWPTDRESATYDELLLRAWWYLEQAATSLDEAITYTAMAFNDVPGFAFRSEIIELAEVKDFEKFAPVNRRTKAREFHHLKAIKSVSTT